MLGKLILVIILSISLCNAKVAYVIKKGQASPINGVVITDELAIYLHKQERKVLVLEDLRIAEKELSETYMKQSNQLEKKLNNVKSEAFWYKVGLGVVTGFLIYRGVSK